MYLIYRWVPIGLSSLLRKNMVSSVRLKNIDCRSRSRSSCQSVSKRGKVNLIRKLSTLIFLRSLLLWSACLPSVSRRSILKISVVRVANASFSFLTIWAWIRSEYRLCSFNVNHSINVVYIFNKTKSYF